MPRKPRYVDDTPRALQAVSAHDCELRIEAAEGESKLKKFTMTAYTGGKMSLNGFRYPVVVDIAGVAAPRQRMPILKDHDDSQIVGHSETIELSQQRIKIAGIMSGVGGTAQEVSALAGNGFPWQASIGANAHQVEFVDRGEHVKVNGRLHSGPVYVARKSTLTETSFVSRGADSATSANVAAQAPNQKDSKMDEFNKFLAAMGCDADHMDEKQLAAAKDTFERLESIKGNKSDDGGKNIATATIDIDEERKKLRAELSKESKRVAAIRKIVADSKGRTDEDKLAEIEAKAIDEDWTEEKTELEVMKATRAAVPSIHVPESISAIKSNPKIIEAALCAAGNLPDAEKQYDDKTLQAAHDAYKGRLSLHTLLLQAAHLNGYRGISVKSDLRGVMEAAFRVNAAFSTLSLPGIMSNTANKFLLAGFNNTETVWREISAIRNVSDFKTVTSYRMIDDMIYEKVGKGGELKHGEVGEESYTNKADTYGKMFAITRQDIINDDLGALTEVPMRLGSGAGDKLNLVFWTEFLDNSDFFKDDHAVSGVAGSPTNDNFDDGTDSALSIDSLTAAELLFRSLVKPNGMPLGVVPTTLLVPPALAVTATLLMSSLEVRNTTASTLYETQNPHRGKFQVRVSSFLNNSLVSGGSALKWYLLADPRQVPVIETCFLNGNQSPIVESADADFNTLGLQMRGYHDFGVAKQDYRGGVGMKGES